MNILITNISTFSYNVFNYTYEVRIADCTVNSVTARHTNESILKCLSQVENVRETGGIHKIIALVSNFALTKKDDRFNNITAYEYVKNKAIESFESTPCFVEVRTETEENKEKDISKILDEICSNISTEDIVYIDAAGGKRTIVNMIQVLTMLLKYKGIQNPLTLYADIQNSPKFITDTKEFEQITNLADAFNLFMTTGRSILLKNCIQLTTTSQEYSHLVDKMCEFSDKINLGKVDDLETTLFSLKQSIELCKIGTPVSNIESVIINQFLPIIEQKFFGNSSEKKNDYIKLVTWCLENDLLQQALTIFTEKMPIEIFERGLLQYHGNIEEARKQHKTNVKNNPILAADWETAMLYSEILSGTKATDENKSQIDELILCLKKKRSSKDKQINDLLEIIRKKDLDNIKKTPETTILKDFCNKNNFKSVDARINSICNNQQVILQLLGINLKEKIEEENKMAAKFSIVAAIKEKNIQAKGNFILSSDIANILYGYLYVKSVRNTVNHASSDENLNEKQKKILAQLGYDFDSYDVQTIKNNIFHALNAINTAKKIEQTTIQPNSPQYIASNELGIKLKIVGHINL